jgi:hypothetical protein
VTKKLEVLFAVDTASLPMRDATPVTVYKGQHWPADDPVVLQHPGMFADDPRYGLSYTVPPPEMAIPPGQSTEDEEPAKGRRSKEGSRG